MVIDFLRVVLWILLCTLVAAIEYTTGLPILTIGLILIAATGLSTVWFIVFITFVTAVIAALFLESWLIIWFLLMVGALIFRRPSHKSRKTFITRLSLIILLALVTALMREPNVTITYVIHTGLSLVATGYLLWRKIMPQHKGFNVAELRFMSEE